MTGDFLGYMAKLGMTDLHPLGRPATYALESALDLSEGHRVLEIGCGAGGALVQIASVHGVILDGLDIRPAMLRAARARLNLIAPGKSINLVCSTGEALPMSGRRYDRVYTESVLGIQNAGAARGMLSEIFRMLKEGGLYVANEAIWKSSVTAAQVEAINAACLADFGIRQASEQPWHLDDWLAVMGEAGFEVLSAEPLEVRLATLGRRPKSWQTRASDLYTLAQRAKGLISPTLRQHRRSYRNHLDAHLEDGKYIESRLFVATRPAGES